MLGTLQSSSMRCCEGSRWKALASFPALTVRGAIEELSGYRDGAWWVQDAAARLPALLLGNVRDMRVLDLCAAPGGKTAELAAVGAHVTALDKSPARMERLCAN